MNKKEFLLKLEKRLAVLSEEERTDTINEYESILSEKVKNGVKEKDAVKDFGDFDELIREILTAYKINPNAGKSTKEKTKEFLDSGEELIKDGAKKLTEGAEKLAHEFKESTSNMDNEKLASIVIKCACFLGAFCILSLILGSVLSIGGGYFDFGLWPAKILFKIGGKLLATFIYIAGIYLLIKTIFKDSFENKKSEGSKIMEEKKSNTKTKKENKTEIKETKEQINNKRSSTDAISELMLGLAKAFVIIAFLLPIICMVVGLSIGLTVIVYFMYKGVGIYGLGILVSGGIIFLSYIATAIYRGIFSHKKIYLYPAIISIVLIIVGSFLTFDYFMNLEYIDGVDTSKFKEMQENFTVTEQTRFVSHYEQVSKNNMIINEDYEDGIITVKYDVNKINYKTTLSQRSICIDDYEYDDYDVDEEHDNYDEDCQKENIILLDFDFNGNLKKSTTEFFENLKNKKIYFNNLPHRNIKIIGNSKTLGLIKVD